MNGGETSVLERLVVSLLSLLESEISENGEAIEDAWIGETHQRIALMRYLPRSGDLDPQQINIAVHAALFSPSFASTDLDENTDTTAANARSGKLWAYAFACVFDQASC